MLTVRDIGSALLVAEEDKDIVAVVEDTELGVLVALVHQKVVAVDVGTDSENLAYLDNYSL